MEWAQSPIVYRKSDEWDVIAPVVKKCFSEKASINHYYGTANSIYHKSLTTDKVKYKKYFYALRPLLCCRWIERFHEIPPMRFDDLLRLFDGTDSDLTEKLLKEINRLVEIKVETEESELNDHIPMIKSFIESELAKQREIVEKIDDDRIKDFGELNELFRSLVIGK